MLSREAYYSLCFAAGAVLLRGPFTPLHAQDANHAIMEARSEVSALVERLATRSGDFKEAFDNAVIYSTIDSTRIEFNALHRADDLHDAAKRLADVFRDKRDENNPAVQDQADKTLAVAAELNRVMLNHHFTDKLQRDWSLLFSDLNALAEVYDLSSLGGEDLTR
jgi:hypothetical protein